MLLAVPEMVLGVFAVEVVNELGSTLAVGATTVFVCGATVTSAYLYVVPETTPAEFLLTHAIP